MNSTRECKGTGVDNLDDVHNPIPENGRATTFVVHAVAPFMKSNPCSTRVTQNRLPSNSTPARHKPL